jgi:hypothetical protein
VTFSLKRFAFTSRLTPQFSGGALSSAKRRERKMKWHARGATAMPLDRPLQLLVMRHSVFRDDSDRVPGRECDQAAYFEH